jgi:hypothetical protein
LEVEMSAVKHCRNCTCELDDSIRFRFCSETCQREFEAEEAEYRYQMACDDKLEKKWREEE